MSAGGERMRGRWADALRAFIAERRACGYAYGRSHVCACERLCSFLGERDMDEAAFAEWVAPRDGEACRTRANRVGLWNVFAGFCVRRDIEAGSFRADVRLESDFVSHIYTDEEASAVFSAADAGIAQRRSPYEPSLIMPAFVRLLYSTGLRFSEAAGLRWDDVDGRRLSVLGKGGKPRLVVMSASMAEVLERYRGLRVGGGGGLVFCGREGGPLQNQLVGTWHRTLLDSAGVRRADGAYPRLHDWRHTFAVGALARMDAAGVDVRAALPVLSRYMGHCGPKETEWYLRLTDEGRAGVLERMELYAPHVAPGLGGV